MVGYEKGRNVGLAFAIVAAGLLTACGGSDATNEAVASTDSEASASLSSPPVTQSSSLTGTPAATAAPGAAYSFTPELMPAGAATGFSIANKPAWASFNVATGQLSGTPGNSDVGTFDGIAITAITASGAAALPTFKIDVRLPSTATAAGSATVSWVPPTAHTDGSALSNLGGYNIYYGDSEESLTNKIQITNPGLTAYTVSGLGAGTHVFGITAYSAAGTESDVAVVGSKTIM